MNVFLKAFALCLLLGIALHPTPSPAQTNAAPAAAPTASSLTSEGDYLPAGISQKEVMINGVKIAYKIGGQGPVVVLLHGFGETSHMWIPLMPLLMKDHTVIAPDMRGFGESDHPPGGYDKVTVAKDIHGLMLKLRYTDEVSLVGHDLGLMVAYAYAAQYPNNVKKVILMDAFLPGVGDWTHVWLMRDLWHFHFYGETPLALVTGRERTYLEHFWNDFAADKTKSIPEGDRVFYAHEYAKGDGMRPGMEYFRNFEQDSKDFAELAKTKLTMPFMVLSGEKAGGQFLIDQTKLVATNVDGRIIPGSGHWLMEEAPDKVMPAIVDFLK
jgi:pimeloyl-ACP methyl ester carboxylesterase